MVGAAIDETWLLKTELKRILFTGQSDFQKVQVSPLNSVPQPSSAGVLQVIETEAFGRTLVMDDKTQSAESDEAVYHEAFVHPAMLAHPNPKTVLPLHPHILSHHRLTAQVFIGGGGEFATAREVNGCTSAQEALSGVRQVLKHKSVEKCVMVDIDKVACDMCREHLPEWNDGAYEDPRFEVYYEDAKAWIENAGQKFDVIIMDICDPIEAGPGIALYFQEYYNYVRANCLNPGGVLVPGVSAAQVCDTVVIGDSIRLLWAPQLHRMLHHH